MGFRAISPPAKQFSSRPGGAGGVERGTGTGTAASSVLWPRCGAAPGLRLERGVVPPPPPQGLSLRAPIRFSFGTALTPGLPRPDAHLFPSRCPPQAANGYQPLAAGGPVQPPFPDPAPQHVWAQPPVGPPHAAAPTRAAALAQPRQPQARPNGAEASSSSSSHMPNPITAEQQALLDLMQETQTWGKGTAPGAQTAGLQPGGPAAVLQQPWYFGATAQVKGGGEGGRGKGRGRAGPQGRPRSFVGSGHFGRLPSICRRLPSAGGGGLV